MGSQPRPPRRRREVVLDPAVVRSRRHFLRLSTSALATALGTSPGVIIRIEEGHGQEKLDLAFVADLSRCLGMGVAELIAPATGVLQGAEEEEAALPLTTDAQQLGSMIAAASGWVGVDDLCDDTGWKIDRVLTALSEIEGRAPLVGLRLAWLGWDVALVAAHPSMRAPATKPAGYRRGVEIDGCRLLYRLTQGHTETLLRRELPAARRRLISLGLAQNGGAKHDAALELTEEARFNLCLGEGNL